MLPGPTRTGDFLRSQLSAEAVEVFVTQTPLGRLGEPDDIADAVAFLASDAARWITGQAIHANGGLL